MQTNVVFYVTSADKVSIFYDVKIRNSEESNVWRLNWVLTNDELRSDELQDDQIKIDQEKDKTGKNLRKCNIIPGLQCSKKMMFTIYSQISKHC